MIRTTLYRGTKIIETTEGKIYALKECPTCHQDVLIDAESIEYAKRVIDIWKWLDGDKGDRG